ncbi:hypothetical protein ABTY61_23195 [Kitasatospora sp. NPDC096128]|uniref:hypothetical protein n=1 Tax=Kitasatospora sp. NPDC096128 TaxID=3155547 RepID=UPI00332982B7
MSAVVVASLQSNAGRAAMDTAVLLDAPRWRAFATSDSDLAGIPAARRRSTMDLAARRVREFAELSGLGHVSIGIPYPSPSGYEEAFTLQHGRERHVSIGIAWLNEDAEHLPLVLEHELAHLRRAHGPQRRVRRCVGSAIVVAAGWFMPVLGAAAATAAVLFLGAAWSWVEELACDLEARRRCGAAAQVARWREQVIRDRGVPRLQRWWIALVGSGSHPPVYLRLLLGGVPAFQALRETRKEAGAPLR